MEITATERGFEIIIFKDLYGMECSLQQSSVAIIAQPGASAVWLGLDGHQMHLEHPQVEELVQHLQNWLETGSFKKQESLAT